MPGFAQFIAAAQQIVIYPRVSFQSHRETCTFREFHSNSVRICNKYGSLGIVNAQNFAVQREFSSFVL